MKSNKAIRTQGTIAILTDEYIDYPKLVIDTIAADLNKKGYGLICIAGRELSQNQDSDDDRVTCNAIYSLAHARKIKGLVSISGSIGHTVDIDTLEVFLNQYDIPKISLNASTNGMPSVLLNDLAGMQQLMRHLLSDKTRQHIAFIRGYPNDPYSLRREKIFREVMHEYGRDIDESLIIQGNYEKFETYTVVTDLLKTGKSVDAIVAANDLMALSAARAISTLGFRIPQDIAITGYDDTREATQNSPALTTVRQPIDTIAKSCVNLLLDIIEGNEFSLDKDANDTSDVVIVDNELIIRGSTTSYSGDDESATIFTKETIHNNLNFSLAGLTPPNDVTILNVTDVYWNSITTGSNQLSNFIERHLDTSIKFADMHWWSNLCHQLEYYTEVLCKRHNEMGHDKFIFSTLARVRERVWSASLDHEFEVHRLEILQTRMQLQMSSCTNSDEILKVLTNWLNTLGAKRSFLAQFEAPTQYPSEKSTLIHAYRHGNVEIFDDNVFDTENLLPPSLRNELEQGLLIMCPVHAGDKLFGFFLMDPTGLQHLNLESTSNSIGNAMRNNYLIKTLKNQTASLQLANGELYKLAQFDALTGVPNRLNFQTRLSSQCKWSAENSEEFALLFIDLDGFKLINDTLGHDAGDRLLQAVALRMENIANTLPAEQAFIARLGGDEFTMIVDHSKNEIDISELIDTVLNSLQNTFVLEDQTLTVSGSVGCAFFPDNGKDAETLVRHADTAMYHAKARGKNCAAYYNSDIDASGTDFLRLAQEMRAALDNQEFTLYFQPKVDLNSGKICGVEALIRWLTDAPDGPRFHSAPDEFIPVAESTGFVTQIDLFALEQACRVARQWEISGRHIPIAVNLSVTLLQKDNFVELTSEILGKTQLTPSLLEFEITERGVMTQVEANVLKLGQLRDMGIRISIDDFGTGYSSLSYLKKLPITSLKIDRSFISDLESTDNEESVDAAIVRSVVAVGKSLDLISIAEGVETYSQVEAVRQIGCEQAQGYFFAKPLPLDEIEALLERDWTINRAA